MKKIAYILSVALAAAACAKTENPANNNETQKPTSEVVFSAVFGDAPVVKSELSGTSVLWKEGDEISIIWNGGKTTSQADAAGAQANFPAIVNPAPEYFAVYPASSEVSLNEGALTVGIPAEQNGKFEDANIAIARTTERDLVFKNLCALGKFTLERNDIAKVEFTGNSGQTLAGNVTLSFDANGIPSIESTDSPADAIVLTPASGDAFAPGNYYFSTIPITLEDGVSFTLTTKSGNIIFGKASGNTTELSRSEALYFGALDNISNADALRLRFIFGPEIGKKEELDPDDNWGSKTKAELKAGVNYTYTLDGEPYNFFARDISGNGKFAWRTNNEKYPDCIGMQTDKVYFGLPAIDGLRLTNVVVGQCRRGKNDLGTNKIIPVGIINSIPLEGENKSYVSGGELQEWKGWDNEAMRIDDHEFKLLGTETNTTYYLNGTNPDIGLYFARLVLTYEKPNSAFVGFPEESEGKDEGEEVADIYDDADIRLLFIGNSFTRDAVYHLPGIIKAAGIEKKIILTHMYYGGRTAQNFYKNWNKNRDFTCYVALPGADDWYTDKTGSASTLAEMAARTDWDIITVQEHTGNQYAWYWTDAEKTALQGIIDYAKSAKPGNTPEVHYVMSQAYLDLTEAGSNQCFNSEAEMYNVITTQARKVMAETTFDGIISTGTMLQNLRTTSLNDELHLTRDGFHMNNGISRYGAACTVFESIITPLTGKNLDGNTYRYAAKADDEITISVTDDNAPIALEAARAAIEKPFEVTEINK